MLEKSQGYLMALSKYKTCLFVRPEGLDHWRTVAIENILHNKRILLILDDVDKSNQIEKLIGGCDWFAFGSWIIITTRNKHLLHTLRICHSTYMVNESGDYEALELFSMHAFQKKKNLGDIIQNLLIKLYVMPRAFH